MLIKKFHWPLLIALMVLQSNPGYAAGKLTLSGVASPPYTLGEDPQDGPGFVNLLVYEIFGRLGIEIEIITLPAERSIINVNLAIADAEMTRVGGLEKKYPNLVMVPEKMLDFEYVAISADPDIKITTWDDLEPYHVGMMTGFKLFEYKVKKAKSITKVTTAKQLFGMLKRGRFDIALHGRWSGLYMLQKLKVDAHVIQPSLATLGSFMYLNKKHKTLVDSIARVLADIKRDGTYQRLADQTLGVYTRD